MPDVVRLVSHRTVVTFAKGARKRNIHCLLLSRPMARLDNKDNWLLFILFCVKVTGRRIIEGFQFLRKVETKPIIRRFVSHIPRTQVLCGHVKTVLQHNESGCNFVTVCNMYFVASRFLNYKLNKNQPNLLINLQMSTRSDYEKISYFHNIAFYLRIHQILYTINILLSLTKFTHPYSIVK